MTKHMSMMGSNHKDTKMRNRCLVLKMVCTNSEISRIDISRLTGLSKMSITNIVSELINEGFIMEQLEPSEAKQNAPSGRRPVFLYPSSDNYFALGIYISRDFAIATISNLKCESIYELSCSFSIEECEDSFKDKIKNLVVNILEISHKKKESILGIGIASIGPLDVKKGIILEPPNFHRLKNIPIKQFLEEEFGFKVYVNNDMNASALAEKMYGKAKNINNFVYVGVTNGIGAGVIQNGSLFEGDMGFSGELGHITINFDGPRCPCGNTGCLELYASIPEIVMQAQNSASLEITSKLSALNIIEWKDIVNNALQGDALALNLVNRLCLYISIGLVSIANIFDPQVIFLGHEIALAGDLVKEKLEENLNKKIFSCKYKKIPVQISAFKDKSPIVGSTAIVLDHLFTNYI